MTKPLCLIAGVGDGTGTALVHRFADGGYRVAMIARNRERLATLEKEIPDTKGYVCDVGDLVALTNVVETIRSDMGNPAVLVHNAVAGGFDRFMDADPADLERNFRVNTTSLLYLARALAPDMVAAKHGAIMVTGNTAALRGVPSYAVFAPTKAAQRILAQSLARDLGPKGVHVAYITVDAAIDVTWLGPECERPPWLIPPPDWQGEREDFFSHPDEIAEEVYHTAHQGRSTWSFDVEIRPFAEKW